MMSGSVGYLLDTNVVLALIRANPLGHFIDQQYGLRAALNRSMICVVTVGEMMSLVRQFNWGQSKRDELQSLLNEVVGSTSTIPTFLMPMARSIMPVSNKVESWVRTTHGSPLQQK